MKIRRIAGLGILVLLVVAATVVIVNSKTSPKSNSLKVVAAENFWGNIAQQLGGPHVQVTSIITNPNADPHLYESDARDAAAVSAANVVIVNGEGYVDFMSKLLGSFSSKNRQVLTAQQILNEPNGANQHLWYDIPRVHEVAAEITARYIAEDPSHKLDYQHNLTTFDDSLQPLLQTIQFIKAHYAGTPVAYTEPVPGYLLLDAGLGVKTPEGFAKAIEDGVDPSPADTQAMDSLMTNKGVTVLLYNAQATSPVTQHVQALAKQAGIPVIGVTETLPASAKSYQSWQAAQLKALKDTLAASK